VAVRSSFKPACSNICCLCCNTVNRWYTLKLDPLSAVMTWARVDADMMQCHCDSCYSQISRIERLPSEQPIFISSATLQSFRSACLQLNAVSHSRLHAK